MHEPVTRRISPNQHTKFGINRLSQATSITLKRSKVRMLWLFGFLIMLSSSVFGVGESEMIKYNLSRNSKPEGNFPELEIDNGYQVHEQLNTHHNNAKSPEVNKMGSADFSIPEGISSGKSPLRYLASDSSVANVRPKDHNKKDEVHLGRLEKQIMRDIEDRPLRITGELVDIAFWEHDCNNNGVCQQHFSKILVSANPDTYSYEPKYTWVCRANFKEEHCNTCVKDFFGSPWYPCPINPLDNVVCGKEGIWDDGLTGTGRCAWYNTNKDPDAFCSSAGAHSSHIEEEIITVGFIILVLIALCCTLLLYLYHKHQSLHLFPESAAAIIFGILVGAFLKYYYQSNHLMRILEFEPHTFFLFLLPTILYQAGFSIKAKIFFRSFWTISSFAIFGTLIASTIFTVIFYYGSSFTSTPFFFIESLQFGTFISAIDPVATISIFKSLRVSEKLYMVVFGESALNDAVSIALAQSAEEVGYKMEQGEIVNYLQVAGEGLLHFVIFFFGSLLVGAIWGIVVSYIFAKFDFHVVPWIEIGLFLILSYLPYVLSEGIHLSGILAIFISAIFMRNYAFHSLSPIGQVTVESMIEMTCNVSENFVFAYMGLSVPLTIHNVNFALVGIGIVALLVSRTVSVFFTWYFVNLFKKDKMPFSFQAIMSFAGLRGAVAFYLALNVKSEFKDMIISLTISLILITIIFLGGTTTWLLKAMAKYFPEDGIFHSDDAEDMLLRREERHSGMSESLYEKERMSGVSQENSIGVITKLEKIDQQYGKKYLRKEKWDGLEENDEPEFQEKYDYQEDSFSPDKDDPYGGLSNYQKSISKYLNDAHVHLGYQDKKSVRLSLRSEARNRNPVGRHSIMRKSYRRQEGTNDPYALKFNSNRRMEPQRSYFLPQTKEQLAELGPSNPKGLLRPVRGLSDPEKQQDRRLSPNIRVGALEDITSKGSHSDSKDPSHQRSIKDQNNSVEEDQSRIQSFKAREKPEERKSPGKDGKKRVNFADQPAQYEDEVFQTKEQVDSKETLNDPKTEDKIKEDTEEKDKDKEDPKEESKDQK